MSTLRPGQWRDLFPKDLPASDSLGWLSLPADPGPDSGDLWPQLAKAVDPRFERPRAKAGVAVERLPGDKGVILSDDKSGAYVHLAPEDFFLWERMDGARTQIDLVVDYCLRYKAMAPARVAALVESLRAQELLVEPPDQLYLNVQKRLTENTFMGRVWAFSQTFLQREFALGGVDGIVGAAYRRGGWVLFTRPVQIGLWLISLAGLIAFLYLLASQQFSALGEGGLVEGALLFGVFQFAALFLHEGAHALTVKAYGRRVRRAGFFLLFGLPGVFVDTTDIWPAGKRAQLAVTWAGPFSNLVLGGLAALLVLFLPGWAFAPAAYQFAVSQYVLIGLNLTPFLRLDGYYLLSDWLEIPNLRLRAGGYLRNGLPNRLRQAWAEGRLLPNFSREEKILVAFGGLSTLWIANLMGLGVITAPVRLMDTLARLAGGGFAGRNPLTILFALVGIFFTLTLLIRGVQMIRGWLERINRALQTAPGWRAALVFGVLALLIAAVPDFLILQGGRAARTGLLYAHGIALTASALAAAYAARLVRELRGASLRPALLGMLLSAIALLAVNVTAVFSAAWPLPVLRWLALTPMLIGAVAAAPQLWRLRGAALGWAAVLVGGALGSFAAAASPAAALSLWTLSGHTLSAAALIMHWQLAHRPLALPRVPAQVDADDPALMLKKAVGAVAREMSEALSEVAGKGALLKLAYEFNNHCADADLPVWLTMKGQLGEKMKGAPEARAPIYRATLEILRTQITARLGSAFADDVQAQALAELPLPLRAVFQRWILGAESAGADDDRVRLRLAGRRLADTLVIGCGRVYGWRLADQAIGGFNRAAAAADWPLYVRGNGRLADDLRGDLLTTAQIYVDALQDLLGRLARVAGVDFAERGVVQVYDTLPWEAREVATTLLFSKLSWARRLTQASTDDPRLPFLRAVPLLSWMAPNDLAALAAQLAPRTVKAGRTVIARDAYLDHALIVRQGGVQAVTTTKGVRRVVEQIGPGGLIGVRSIADHQPAPYEYVAQTNAEVWLIPSAYVVNRLHPLLHLQDALDDERATASLLSRIPLFAALDAAQRAALAKALERQRLPPGSVVLQQGAESQGFFVVQAGELEVVVSTPNDGERRVSTLGPGEFFGEAALLNRTPITATVRAHTDCELLRLPPPEFYALLSSGLAATLDQVQSRRAKERLRVSQMAGAESAAGQRPFER
jgi:putative peptide zinc metalloprotease protein